MLVIKRFLTNISLAVIIITTFSAVAKANSVYVIADTTTYGNQPSIVQAYEVQDSNLVYQAQYSTAHSLAVGIAIDTDAEFLFITHEDFSQSPGNLIEIVDTRSMQYVDTALQNRKGGGYLHFGQAEGFLKNN